MAKVRKVSEFMTPFPISIDSDAAVREAATLMTVNGFRHLPVVRAGETIGVISDRDLQLAQSLSGVDLESIRVGDVARHELYTVSPDESVDVVVLALAEKKIGSAVVLLENQLVGIFTTTDALYALSTVLNESER